MIVLSHLKNILNGNSGGMNTETGWKQKAIFLELITRHLVEIMVSSLEMQKAEAVVQEVETGISHRQVYLLECVRDLGNHLLVVIQSVEEWNRFL
ncbi:unnamed protein product [Allacma fusca]|uniref:Uncharacterized protein n=1 Tax=Allacma fusca TaxID=39272 RepID=A0A8J2PAG5_9HEXA|nr:unnamed protein product [Allacma fusca]